ncbi:MAG: hypothetical protein ACTHMC_21905 [Pseudobacter sp.]|uniref:hypothetical protein n=1 Tax=Pseudobacter sp. TaxID=2045420 RepID=UPI003F81631C
MPSLLVYPPYILAEWIPVKERPKHIYKIEFYGDIDGNRWTAIIDLILAYKPIKAKFIEILSTKVRYKIGCTEISLAIFGEGGSVLRNFTPSKTIKGKYTQSVQVNQNKSYKISPAVKMENAEIQGGSYESGKGQQFTHTVEFECEEKYLAERHEISGVEWTLTHPPQQTMLRNFMYGNMLLNAVFEWSGPKSGNITVIPLNIGVFNVKNEHIGPRASMMTEFFLFCRGHRVANRNGVTFKFEIQ